MVALEKALDGEESERMARDWERTELLVPVVRGGDGGGDDNDGEANGGPGARRERTDPPPYGTVGELLSAPFDDVRKSWEQMVSRMDN